MNLTFRTEKVLQTIEATASQSNTKINAETTPELSPTNASKKEVTKTVKRVSSKFSAQKQCYTFAMYIQKVTINLVIKNGIFYKDFLV